MSAPNASNAIHPTISVIGWDDPEVVALCQEQAYELALRYGSDPDAAAGNAAVEVDVMFIVRDGAGRAMGCGGVRRIAYPEDLPAGLDPSQVGEIKRMYISPRYRGYGASRILLSELEAAARRQGWNRLQLECGLVQPEAMALYEKSGYTRIPSFGQYKASPASTCLAKNLPDGG